MAEGHLAEAAVEMRAAWEVLVAPAVEVAGWSVDWGQAAAAGRETAAEVMEVAAQATETAVVAKARVTVGAKVTGMVAVMAQ